MGIYFLTLFSNYSLHSVLFCFSFRCTAYWLDEHTLYQRPPWHSQYPPGTTESYYDCQLSCATLYIPVTMSKLPVCTSQSPHPCHPALNSSPLAPTSMSSLSLTLFKLCLLVYWFICCSLDSTHTTTPLFPIAKKKAYIFGSIQIFLKFQIDLQFCPSLLL